MNRAQLEIRPEETFPTLGRAPIVEAVLELRFAPGAKLAEEGCQEILKRSLSGYEFLGVRQHFRIEGEFQFESRSHSQSVRDLGWKGLRFRSEDQKHVADFNRDGFAFSRLQPYVNWDQFTKEGLRLWDIYEGIAKPSEIEGIGLRFINQIPLPKGEAKAEEYFRRTPEPPEGLGIAESSFTHQELYDVPGHPYRISLVKIRGAPNEWGGPGEGGVLILDIDVLCKQPSQVADFRLKERLKEMRWLKNKAFFGSLTPSALKQFE